MHLIVCQRNVIFVDGVPFLNADLLWPRASLCCNQLLQVPDRVVLVALHADLLAQAIVENDLNHADCLAAAVAVAPAAVVPGLLLWWCCGGAGELDQDECVCAPPGTPLAKPAGSF